MWKRIKQYFKEYFEYRKNRRAVMASMAQLAAVATPVLTDVANETEKVVTAVGKVTNVILQSTPESLVGDVIAGAAEALNTTQPQLMQTVQYIFSLPIEDVENLVVNATLALNMEKIEEIRAEESSDVNDVQEMG